MNQPSILIADDDRLVLATLSQGLRAAGYRVFPAASGEEALELAREHRPDVALLDIRMPGLSGIEVAHRLRRETGTPVVFLTAYGEAELVEEAAREGGYAYLVKPLDVERLIPNLKTAMARAEDKERMGNALESGRETNAAIGILMERHHLDRKTAGEALRRQARSQRQRIQAVAREIIEAEERLNQSPERDP